MQSVVCWAEAGVQAAVLQAVAGQVAAVRLQIAELQCMSAVAAVGLAVAKSVMWQAIEFGFVVVVRQWQCASLGCLQWQLLQ